MSRTSPRRADRAAVGRGVQESAGFRARAVGEVIFGEIEVGRAPTGQAHLVDGRMAL
jgi:hypothetical protein